MKIFKGIFVVAVIAFFGTLIISLINKDKNKDKEVNVIEVAHPVKVESPKKGYIADKITSPGEIKPIIEINITPKFPERIEEILVRESDKVSKGQVIARLEKNSVETKVNAAKAGIESANYQLKQLEISLKAMKKDLVRFEQLFSENAVSEQAYDKVKSQYEAMQAQKDSINSKLKELNERLNDAKLMLNEATIISPIDGIVAGSYFEAGDIASTKAPMFKLIDVSKIKIITSISEKYYQFIKPNKTKAVAVIDAIKDCNLQGTVAKFYPMLDAKTKTIRLEIQFDNPSCMILSNMFAKVEIILSEKQNAISVPFAVIKKIGDKKFVYVEDNGIVKLNEVEVGILSGEYIEIVKGLTGEEHIIVSGTSKLKDGDKVVVSTN